jgi:hypothetical protein
LLIGKDEARNPVTESKNTPIFRAKDLLIGNLYMKEMS